MNAGKKRVIKVRKGKCYVCNSFKSQTFSKQKTRGSSFQQKQNLETDIVAFSQTQPGLIHIAIALF